MSESSAAASSEPAGLAPGTVVGGRFEVVGRVAEDALAVVWSATDQQSKRGIALRVLKPGLLPAHAAPEFREACRTAASLSHRNIGRVFGVGRTPKGEQFIACEWIDGTPVSEFVQERGKSGDPVSLRGTYNVVAHVCNALTYAHEKTAHGTLRPGAVWVTRGGRVKVRDFGVGQVLLGAVGPSAFRDADFACLAPEVKRGEPATTQADVFGIGAILYELLTGRSPGEGFVPPSHIRDDVPSQLDDILLRCLMPDAADRYETPEAVRLALLPHVAEANSLPPEEAEPGMDVEIELGSVLPPPGLEIPEVKVPPPPPKRQIGELLEKLSADPTQRWMVARDKADHGPFNARELIERLNIGGFSGADLTMNTDTAERKPLREWPEFHEFVVQREHQDLVNAEAEAKVKAKKSERRSSAMKWLIAVGVISVVALAVVGYFRGLSSGARESFAAQLGDLFEFGDIPVGEAGLLPDRPAGKRKARKRRRSRSNRGGFSSYEDAMNRAVEMGDATRGGGESRLTGNQVANVMNRNLNRFYSKCVQSEMKSGARLGTVKIDLAIAGSGKVLGASVRQGSSTFRSCLSKQVSAVRFPKFGAPRMGAQYRFSVN